MKKIITIAFVFRLILLFISASHPDLGNHLDWGIRFLKLGPVKFYENIFWSVSWPNQPLGSILLFALMAKINQTLFSAISFVNQTIPIFPSFIIPVLEKNLHLWLVKLPFIISDLLLAKLIYRLVKSKYPQKALLATSLFLFNPIVIYNSTIWGQTDSLVNLLSFDGLIFLYQKKYFRAVFLFFSSLLFKLSLIIYLPIFTIVFLKNKKGYRKILIALFLFFIFSLFLANFFSGEKTALNWFVYLYQNRILPRQGSMLNGNAFNLWFLLFGLDLSNSEFLPILKISAQTWGRLIFVVLSLPLLFKLLRKNNFINLLNTCFLIAYTAFLFLTNMHERYLYPVFLPFTLLLFFQSKTFKLKHYLIISFIHLLNLYNLWFYPSIPFLKKLLEYKSFSLPRLLAFVLICFWLNFYIKYLKHENKS